MIFMEAVQNDQGIVVRKIFCLTEGEERCEIQLGGDIEVGNPPVILHVPSLDVAKMLFEACKGITKLEVIS